MIIKVSTSFPAEEFERLIPPYLAQEGFSFVVNKPVPYADAWVVCDGLPSADITSVDPRAVYFFMGEAPKYRSYAPDFLAQFARVLGYGRPKHIGFEEGNIAHNYFVAGSYNQLQALAPAKTKLLSAVASSKTTIAGHRQRVELLRYLGQHLEFDIYGRGWREGIARIPNAKCRYVADKTIETTLDKTTALAPYRYSIAIENADTPHYWTEKISDCILCGTLPFYWGTRNLERYLPEESFVRIYPREPARTLSIIRDALVQDLYSQRRAALAEAKAILLSQHTLPLRILQKVRQWAPASLLPVPVALSPEPAPTYWQRKWLKVKHRLGI
jgi:hypothetical protein